MGILRSFLALIIIAISIPFQGFSQKSNSENLTTSETGILDTYLSSYTIMDIQMDEIAELYSIQTDATFELQGPANSMFRLHMFKNDVINPGYVLNTSDGKSRTNRKVLTLSGYNGNNPGNLAAITIADDFISGFIQKGEDTYYLEPLSHFLSGYNGQKFILYNQENYLRDDKGICGLESSASFGPKESHEHENATEEKRLVGQCYELEIAVASDYSMFQEYGSVAGVENRNITVINNVQTNYDNEFGDEIQFNIVTQWISNCSSCDPWTSSNDPGDLLPDFRSWGNGGGFGVSFDVGSLWSNRDFSGNTIGLAYVGAVCSNWQYHVLEDFSNNAQLIRVLMAHELGHNFNAEHDDPNSGFIMQPSVSESTIWSTASINTIDNYINNTASSCMDECTPPAPPAAFFSAEYDFVCPGSRVHFIDETTNEPNSWFWSFPGGNPSSSTLQHPSVIYEFEGSYDVSLTATNNFGTDDITLNGVVVVSSQGTMVFISDSFEGDLSQWTIDNSDGDKTWEINSNIGGSQNGLQAAYVNNYGYNQQGERDGLISPEMDFTSRQNIHLMMDYAYVRHSAAFFDSLAVRVSLDGGNSFPHTIFSETENGSGNFATGPEQSSAFTPNNDDDWCYWASNPDCIDISLDGFSGESSVVVKIDNVNGWGNNMFIDNVLITADCQFLTPPTASFSSDEIEACAPVIVSYFDESIGIVTDWLWEFEGGDPEFSTDQNPSVFYENSGVFDVSLTVSNAAGSDDVTITDYIVIRQTPLSDWTYLQNGQTVNFTAEDQTADFYDWDFGDGNTSSQANPTHTYASDGTYTVTLTVSNSCGSDESMQIIEISTASVANWMASATEGCTPLIVNFTNQSSSNVTSFSWLFPGGTPATSTLENPVVVYSSAGSFDVTLMVSGPQGNDTLTRVNIIQVNDEPIASFTSSIDGAVVQFQSTSQGATGYNWNFGDGGTATIQNPEHTYSQDGQYTVTLITTNQCGEDTVSQMVTIATPPIAGFGPSAIEGCIPLTVEFSNNSSANSNSFLWIFEGGNPQTSTEEEPSVIYENTGSFNVTLIAINSTGEDTMMQQEVIVVNDKPNPSFTFSVDDLTVSFMSSSSIPGTYNWDFGDGASSNLANPTHTYNMHGSYNVQLMMTNECGSNTFLQIIGTGQLPNAQFSAEAQEGCAPFEVQFIDQSLNAESWSWTFEGGNPGSSSEQNPIITFAQPGAYDVTLAVSNSNGDNETTLTDYITVHEAPTAQFSYMVNNGTITFTNLSNNADSYLWEFGDGSTSTDINPVYTYTESGEYIVTLHAESAFCDADLKTRTINVIILSTEDGSLYDNQINIYPNPVQDAFIVEVPEDFNFEKLSIHTVQGKLIQTIGKTEFNSLGENKFRFQLNEYAGLLIIKLEGEHSIVIRRIVKVD